MLPSPPATKDPRGAEIEQKLTISTRRRTKGTSRGEIANRKAAQKGGFSVLPIYARES